MNIPWTIALTATLSPWGSSQLAWAQALVPERFPDTLPPLQPPTPLQPQPPPLQIQPALPLPTPVLPPGDTLLVKQFIFQGNTVFTEQELTALVAPFVGRSLRFADLIEVRSAITRLYVDAGYTTSAAYLPTQTYHPASGAITIAITEDRLETINLVGGDSLHRYVRSRLAAATAPIVNTERLLEALRWLQVDPLVQSISAQLRPSTRPGRSVLDVQLATNRLIALEAEINNYRSPAVGSWQGTLSLTHLNLSGLGDRLNVQYRRTESSNAGILDYEVPFNPQDGTVRITASYVDAGIIEPPFNALDIASAGPSAEVVVHQPLWRRATEAFTQEAAVSVGLSYQKSASRLLGIPFPLNPGADQQGRLEIAAVRLSQDWLHRGDRQVVRARSQFSAGLPLGTLNPEPPDSRFFTWQGQVLWLRRLPWNLSLLTRAELQLADRPLVAIEQFTLGGVATVRGYRQDALLTDNGVFGSAELRIPVYAGRAGVLQVAPFFEIGHAWNSRNPFPPSQDTLAGVGLGLEYAWGDRLTARLDWGYPLFRFADENRTLQEQGIYFSLRYRLF